MERETATGFAAWLGELLARRGISQSQLAAYIGMRPSAVSDWLAGKKRPAPASLRRLAAYAGVPAEEVLRIAGHLDAEAATPERGRPRSLRDEAMGLISALPFEVPVYEDFPIHAGQGGIPIDVVYLPAMQRRPGSVIGLVVRGNCMAPAIEDGEIVVVDLEAEVEDGDVVAVELDDGWALRRCWFRNGGYGLVCDNPASQPREPLPPMPAQVYPVIDVRRGRPKRRRADPEH